MLKLNQADATTLTAHLEDLAQTYAALTAAVDAFNAAMREAWRAVETVQGSYDALLDEWNTWRLEVGAEGREYFEGRSATWQASPQGQAYAAWIKPYEDEQLFPPCEIEPPDEVQLDITDPADAMARLGTEPEEVA